MSDNNSNHFPPLLGLIIGILAVSTAAIFIRFAQEDMPSIVIAAGRMSIASIILSLLILPRNWLKIRQIDRKSWLFLGLAGVFLGFHFAAWITSLEMTSVASSVVLVTTAPLWVAILSPVFLKEKLTSWIILGLLIALAGSTIVGFSQNIQVADGRVIIEPGNISWNSTNLAGNLLALIGAFLSAGYLIVGRRVRKHLDLGVYTCIVYSVAAMTLLVIVLFSGLSFTGYPTISYVWLFALGLIPQLIGHSAFNWALKHLPAAIVSTALLGEPVGTVILAYLFLREQPTLTEIIGGLLILVGILVATRKSRQASSY